MLDLPSRVHSLEAQVSSLERLVQFLLKVNGLDLSALRGASDRDLLKLYQNVILLLPIPASGIDPEVMKRWAETFLQLSEFELTRIKLMVDYDHTWQPFYQACSKMLAEIRRQPEFSANVDLQTLYGVLDRGRRNLRDAAVLLIQNASSEPPPMIKTLLRECQAPNTLK